MTSNAAVQTEAPALVACTISRDVQIFDLLIEDMETALGETWGDLSFNDAIPFLQQPEAETLKFFALAMDHEDEANIDQIMTIISAAKAKDIKVILITEDVSPASLHQMLREGGDEFVPYPLPEDELSNAIERVLTPAEEAHSSTCRVAKLCWNSLLTQKQWTASPSCKRCCHTSRS